MSFAKKKSTTTKTTDGEKMDDLSLSLLSLLLLSIDALNTVYDKNCDDNNDNNDQLGIVQDYHVRDEEEGY